MLSKIILLLLSVLISEAVYAQDVYVLKLNSAIFSPTAEYIREGIKTAERSKATCLVLMINTPGGLLDPTRKIVGDIMSSTVPVITYVAPAGAHAGSAGSFITLAGNLVAMSPGSNIGAAHPVMGNGKSPDSVMNEKITNDAVAFIRSIAERRRRDPNLIKEMVTNSRSFSAKTAVDKHIADLMANNIPDLLRKINGKTVVLDSGGSVILHTQPATIKTLEMSARQRFLNTLSEPNIMYVLLLIGILGVLFEFFNPGGLAPGIIGVICLILAAYGMSMLPVNYTGLALILVGIVLFVLEIKFTSYGLLSISGAVCLFLGAMFLIKKGPSFDVVRISWAVLISSVVITALFFVIIIGIGVKAQFNRVLMGRRAMVGKTGIAVEELTPNGRVRVDGEFWRAKAEKEPIAKGANIEVVRMDKFQLTVKNLPSSS